MLIAIIGGYIMEIIFSIGRTRDVIMPIKVVSHFEAKLCTGVFMLKRSYLKLLTKRLKNSRLDSSSHKKSAYKSSADRTCIPGLG